MNDIAEKKLYISAEAADKLLACADGLATLLYLHILRTGNLSISGAAMKLRRSREEVFSAAENLRSMGLIKAEEPLEEPDELPQYTADEITQRAKTDPGFEAVIQEGQQRLGKLLSNNDMRILFGIYDHLGLPAEVIMELINHCVETYAARNGEGRIPTMRYIEKEAYFWARNEIMTPETADEHIRAEKQRGEVMHQLQEVLQIRGRAPTKTEAGYMEDWLSLGFTPDVLGIAYDRTVVSTGKMAWKYMDKIVRSWHEKNLHTREEIETGDRRVQKPVQSQANDTPSSNMDRMKEILDRMKNGK